MRVKLSKQRGVTLVELMVTVTIAGVLAGIAIPSFISSIRSSRLTAATNEFITAMNLARSEAVKRGEIVVIKKKHTNWEEGWQVFVDIDRSSPSTDANTYQAGANSTLCESGEDCLLREYDALSGSFTLRTSQFTDFISFNPSGVANAAGGFVVCDNHDNNNIPEAWTSRLIAINSIGRIRIADDIDHDGIPNTDAAGNPNITSCSSTS